MAVRDIAQVYYRTPLFSGVADGMLNMWDGLQIDDNVDKWNAETMPIELMELAFDEWEINELYTRLLGDDVTRKVFDVRWRLLQNLTLPAVIPLFANATETVVYYRLDKRNQPGDPTDDAVIGLTLFIHPLVPRELTVGIQRYLRDAYTFLLRTGLVITLQISNLIEWNPRINIAVRGSHYHDMTV